MNNQVPKWWIVVEVLAVIFLVFVAGLSFYSGYMVSEAVHQTYKVGN